MSWEFFSARTRTARKPYRCDEAECEIAVGDTYEYGFGKCEGFPLTQRLCTVCALIIGEGFLADLWDDEGFPLTQVRNELRDEHGIADAEAWAIQHRAERLAGAAAKAEAQAVADYNARFDPADEAGREIFEAAYRLGWLSARFPDGWDADGEEEYRRYVDGVETGEAWHAHRDEFFARLPLAALGERPTPGATERKP